MNSLGKQTKLWNMDLRFGICNIRSLCGAGSLMTKVRVFSVYATLIS
jgi:hypothetical protein